jgi:hypothetical protein
LAEPCREAIAFQAGLRDAELQRVHAKVDQAVQLQVVQGGLAPGAPEILRAALRASDLPKA